MTLSFRTILSLTFLLGGVSLFASSPIKDLSGVERAKELREYIRKEKPKFTERENEKRDLLEELDRLNTEQNRIRERLSNITSNQQEMTMALENLSVEFKKQRELEATEKKRLTMLFKVLYKIRKDGMLRFLVNGDNLTNVGGRIRILYRTLRSHSILTRQLEERAVRLGQSEKKLTEAKDEMQKLLSELGEQEGLLKEFLDKKHVLLKSLNQKQQYFQTALREYKTISKELSALFDNFESLRDSDGKFVPHRSSLPLPVDVGKLVKNFGKSVNERFGTVTYQKGIEILADHHSEVKAVLPGVVEFDGWVKGLGNVLILHHGGGFYSLSAHLFKSLKPKGTSVVQGEIIGLVGDTGNNDKPSLYFELRENAKAVDPVAYFSRTALQKLHN
jgi:septal ring factor EnvC (AmiA/AmiB activator)